LINSILETQKEGASNPQMSFWRYRQTPVIKQLRNAYTVVQAFTFLLLMITLNWRFPEFIKQEANTSSEICLGLGFYPYPLAKIRRILETRKFIA